MSTPNKNTTKNITMSIMFMSGANFLTFIILMWVYSVTMEIWFLIAGIAMLVSGVVFMIVVSKFKAKLDKLNQLKQRNQSEPNEPS